MSKTSLIFAALLMIPATGISSTEQAPTKPKMTVEQFVKSYMRAMNHSDVTAMMKMFSKEDGVTSVGDGTIAHGWGSIKTDAQQFVGREGTFRFSMGAVEVTPLGSSHVLAVAPITVQTLGQEEDIEVPAAMTFVLQREGKSWKVIHEHWSSKDADDSAVEGDPGDGDGPSFESPEGSAPDHDPRLDLTASPRAKSRHPHGATRRVTAKPASASTL